MQAVPCESLKHMIVPIMCLAESQETGHSPQVYKALYLSVVLHPIIIPKVFPLVILTVESGIRKRRGRISIIDMNKGSKSLTPELER